MRTPKKAWKDIAKKLKNRKSTSAAKVADIEESMAIPNDVKDSLGEQEEVTSVDKATETDTELYEDINENSETGQPMCESREELQNASIDTTAQEPNAPDNPSTAEPSGKGNSADEKSSKKAIQPIIAGIVGAVLLVSCIASYIMKMHIIAAVVGIIGLACMSFALYSTLKPNTKLEEVENVEQSVHPSLNPT
ncbi:hypothetical protein [Wolbachia endosymbiont of Atemnus politus]|uniref:hypothetical protein n=1 Tax=Wolbachia endosymbiont of Atemnus politus TaxID=2682840 RepID=UPI001FE5AEA2|nr:hypothetical protein [Wolbachia endosymbiont of Atemnus politus]